MAVFLPAPPTRDHAHTDTPVGSAGVRLATFNLLHGRSLSDGAVHAERVAAAVSELDADVLALQEVDRAQPRSGLLDLTVIAAEALGAPTHRFAAAVAGTPGETWHPWQS